MVEFYFSMETVRGCQNFTVLVCECVKKSNEPSTSSEKVLMYLIILRLWRSRSRHPLPPTAWSHSVSSLRIPFHLPQTAQSLCAADCCRRLSSLHDLLLAHYQRHCHKVNCNSILKGELTVTPSPRYRRVQPLSSFNDQKSAIRPPFR